MEETTKTMLARHALELAECPPEHALAVATKHYCESVAVANELVDALRTRLKDAQELARLGGWKE